MINGIGFTGRMKSGKDTCAQYVIKHLLEAKGTNYGIDKIAFADSLKEICMKYLGLTKYQCYDQDGKEEYNKFWGMTNREILQRVGTEAMRNGFHPDVWSKITELKIKEIVKNNRFFIITDIRFPNEAETVKRNGGLVVHVSRPNTIANGIINHASEVPIPKDLIDFFIINDRDLPSLERNINLFVDNYVLHR